jgi:NitT/TauT family transport system permease protein
LELVRKVIIPAIQPGVLTGIRLAVAVAWIVLVPAEMLGVDSGLGYVVLNSRDQLAYDQLAAAMFTIGLTGFLMDLSLRKLLKARY